ncbi:MIP/aquaporin family protein [Wohlfahrtiimonas sp. G9077]|uniref:MIP/aquaporin family protein n=1 Tax=Wohlfahrtiimonas sp. G9077 TaxID=1980118 RepID=UPI000B99C4A0|nr:MIP/aquaporin family protein [Wohlfahrtiimonas sp. G9077]OYQ73699.1 aquaporin [Wohlfahrtiimonas sp. G9077]
MPSYIAEFIGTAIMILFGGGVVANVVLNRSKAAGGGWIVITMGWGFAVMLAIYAVGQYSGGHFNPAVTLGLAIANKFPWVHVIGYVIAQILGAMLGAFLVWLHFKPHFAVTDNAAAKRDIFCTSPAIESYRDNVMSEVIGTAILMFAILFIGINEFTGGLLPVVVGFLIMAIGLSLGGTTGYAINPARDFGPRLMHAILPIAGKTDSNWRYAFIPVLGPLVGTVIGAALYGVLYREGADNTMSFLGSLVWLALGGIALVYLLRFAQRKQAEKTQKF